MAQVKIFFSVQVVKMNFDARFPVKKQTKLIKN